MRGNRKDDHDQRVNGPNRNGYRHGARNNQAGERAGRLHAVRAKRTANRKPGN